MVMIPAGLEPENDRAVEGRAIANERPVLSLERASHINKSATV
jgi:hypothetical protein